MDPDAGPGQAAGRLPADWYKRLCDRDEFSEAILFLSLALPRFECLAWGAQGLIEIVAVDRNDPLMLKVLRWIDNPEDGARRQIMAMALDEGRESPQKLLGMAVGFSGGSILPPDSPPLQPPPDACGKMVSGALLSGVYSQPVPKTAIETVLAIGERMVCA
jgi:hypothetical protein